MLLDRAEEELKTAHLGPERDGVAAGELAVLRGILDLWAGNAERLIAELQRALVLLPPDSSHLRGLAHMGIAAGFWQSGDRSGAWEYLDEQLAETPTHLPVYATLLQTQCFFHWIDGSIQDLQVSARRLLNVSEELDLPEQKAIARYFLGIAHFAGNELDLARHELTAAVAARFDLRLLWWCQAAGVLALTQHALGEPEQARLTLAEARDFLLERHALRVLPDLGAFQADLDRLQGRMADASAWVAQVQPGPLTWALGICQSSPGASARDTCPGAAVGY